MSDPFADSPWRPYIAYSTFHGSKAYGTDTPESDTDIKGFYVPPTRAILGLDQPPEQLESKDPDVVYYEIGKFVRLALKGNPAILETLWGATGREFFPHDQGELKIARRFLSDARDQVRYLVEYGKEWFLGKHLVRPYVGMARAHMHKLLGRHAESDRERRDAAHMIRVMHAALHIAESHQIMVWVPPSLRRELLAIRRGETPWPQVIDWFHDLEGRVDEAFIKSDLPDGPQVDQADAWLRQMRLDML